MDTPTKQRGHSQPHLGEIEATKGANAKCDKGG